MVRKSDYYGMAGSSSIRSANNYTRMKYLLAILCSIIALSALATPLEIERTLEHELSRYHSDSLPYDLAKDVEWAAPEGFELTMDIYTPKTGRNSYPVIVMFHGGGWLINSKSIMNEAAAYLATHGEYVVCNVNYRLLVDLGNTVRMNEIVEDAFGAVLWVKAHIDQYKGDPARVIVTGDSAGGHLASIITLQGRQLSSKRFMGAPHGFQPSWLPAGKTAEEVAAEDGLAVQAAIISYGAFDLYGSAMAGFEEASNFFWVIGNAQPRGIFGEQINHEDHPEYYYKVSPKYNIPQAEQHALPPMLFTVGEKDDLTTPASIQEFMELLKAAGHDDLEYWEHQGRPHAFLDSGKNDFLQISFAKDAPPALDVMLDFLDKLFYGKGQK